MSLIEIENLNVRYENQNESDVHAVSDVSLNINTGDTFGLVGESGCGKTTLAKSIIRLLDPSGYISDGEIIYKNKDLTSLPMEEVRDIRWSEISFIPQSSMDALNPVFTVGDQIAEAILRHQDVSKTEAKERSKELLERVGVDAERASDFAHEFSGGMKQRAMIAMALACDPDLIIADEPTTALDVIVQDQVLQELEDIQRDFDVSFLIISHDISVIAETCDRVGVMYGGKMMEIGSAEDIFQNPSNPYTLGLENSFPNIKEAQDSLVSIPGSTPRLEGEPDGCRFRERCPFATEICDTGHPPLYVVDRGSERHRSACYHLERLDEIQAKAKEETTWE